jgi:Domain of unknown function (DUF4184)
MPWTFAHPAAVLPLRSVSRRGLSFCALVVGSMTPDFGFYFGAFSASRKAHTFWGLFAICLPSGLALLACIRVLHRPISQLLPSPHRQRLLSLPPIRSLGSATAFFWASISILIGGITHIFWDSFTHQSGYFVMQWPILQQLYFVPGGKGLELYEVLQDVSSILGAAILIGAYTHWVRGDDISRSTPEQPGGERWRYQLLAIIAIAALVVAAPLAYCVSVTSHGRMNPVLFAVRLHMYSTAAFFVLLSTASIAVARRASGNSGSSRREV